MNFFLLLVTLPLALSVPPKNTKGGKCFYGGEKFKEVNASMNMAEVCLRDDISLIKSISHHALSSDRSKIESSVSYYRLFFVKEWFNCNPIEDVAGTFLVLDVDYTGNIVAKIYACRATCEITTEQDTGNILIKSEELNHYSIQGTTIKNGWFKGTIEVSLEATCEHIHITCGHKTIEFNACFRTHKKCIRYFKKSILPELIIESFCTNMELIILLIFGIVSVIMSIILTKTYLVYLLIPIFYPFVKAYGIFYEKCMKKCKNCGLAVHPFSKCPISCICGMQYNSTEALKVHRQCKNCTGFKSLTHTRSLCKKKLPNAALAIMVTILFFSFITPISSKCYEEEQLVDEFRSALNDLQETTTRNNIYICVLAGIVVLISMRLIIMRYYLKVRYVVCNYCGLIHLRQGLVLEQGFTNKCLTCICANKNIHKATQDCLSHSHMKSYKYSQILILSLIVLSLLSPVYSSPCLQPEDLNSLEEMSLCLALYQNQTRNTEYSQLMTQLKVHIHEDELNMLLPTTKPTFKEMIKKIETANDYHMSTIYEYINGLMYPETLKALLKSAGDTTIEWRTYFKNTGLHACDKNIEKMICRCVLEQKECGNTKVDAAKTLENYYTSKPGELKEDMTILAKGLSKAFPGLVTVLLNQIVNSEKYELFPHVTSKIKLASTDNRQLTGILNFLEFVAEKNMTKKEKQLRSLPSIRHLGEKFTHKTAGEKNIKKCTEPKTVRCTGKRLRSLVIEFQACNSNGIRLYKQPKYPRIMVGSLLCLADKHCLQDFIPISTEDSVEKLQCYASQSADESNGMLIAKSDVRLKKIGKCTINSEKKSIVKSKDGKYYEYKVLQHKKTAMVDEYCLSSECDEQFYPYHVDNLKSCTWRESTHDTISQTKVVHNDIESFASAIKLSLHNDLTTHHFKPTDSLPHVIPNYKGISIKGTENENGIQNAFVLFTIPLQSGHSQGFTLTAINSAKIFDIVVYVKQAKIKAQYVYQYSTGPTIGINVKHEELCTGSCPHDIPRDQNWLTFSKEHTSAWGCESWGCLAIGTGCVYGSCQDVIREEGYVYKKLGSEEIETEICISDPYETLCNKIDVLEPILTDTMQVEITSQQTNLLKEIVFVKDKNIYSGDINPKGTYAKKCGSVQKVGSLISGIGNPKFDYHCHAMSRKDIILRRCYDNEYISCSTLQSEPDLKIEKDNEKTFILSDGNLLGSAAIRLNLGDIKYKSVSAAEIQVSGFGTCGGCIQCFTDIACKLEITSTGIKQCEIASNCYVYTSNILVQEGVNTLSIKLKCLSKEIKVSICKTKIDLKSSVVEDHSVLDLTSSDQTSYIKEYDKKCSTWLCRVYDEGLGFIFKPFWSEINLWGKYVLIIVGLCLLIVIIAKLIAPLVKYIISTLKYNDYIYKIENKMH
uniref:Envelopment polyprotein n=2 Tax=Peaton virus TaxID=159151 RepID=E0D478_9VIRU|nr:M polyprotein [Peaton virus]